MPRGGAHPGNLKPTWKAGKTCVIRVPEARRNQILAIAKILDEYEVQPKFIEAGSYQEAVNILKNARELPRNSGSKYWKEIKKALDVLGEDYDPR